MMKLRTFLQDNAAALLCTVALAAICIISWRLLAAPPDRQLPPTYALADTTSPMLRDFRADALDWQSYDYPVPPPLPTDASAVYLSWEIPYSSRFMNCNLLFTTTNQDIAVYLDDDFLYRYGDWSGRTETRGRTIHYIPLDNKAAGRRLTILLHTTDMGRRGSIDDFEIDTTTQFMKNISFADAIYISALSIALAMIAFLSLNLSWRALQDIHRRALIYLIAFLAAFALWTTGNTSLFPRLFGMPALWWELHLAMIYALPVCWALVVREIVAPQYHARVKNILHIFVGIFAAATLAELIGRNAYSSMLPFYNVLIFSSDLILIHALVRSHWAYHPACRYAAFGLIAFVALSIFDVLHWEHHLFTGILSMAVFSVYAMVPLILHLIRIQMMEEATLERQNERLSQELAASQDAAKRDFLTGCYNRHQLDVGFARFSTLAHERGFRFSLALFDIDHFKQVNDTHGHLAGDQVLRDIAAIIHDEIDRRHIFIRYGGDEFILLGLHYDLEAMTAFCERLRAILEERMGGVTLSFGISTWHGGCDSLPGLIARADRALYRSKEKGRNAVSDESEIDAA